MNFNEYQKQALKTAINNPDQLMNKTIWAMGIAGESGEIIEKWKKIVAYKDGTISQEDIADLTKELGDVLWYLAIFAHSLNISLEDIARLNLKKLEDRSKRDVIMGAGDNR